VDKLSDKQTQQGVSGTSTDKTRIKMADIRLESWAYGWDVDNQTDEMLERLLSE
jgi:hypothetical protein